jgi:beta-glucosidase
MVPAARSFATFRNSILAATVMLLLLFGPATCASNPPADRVVTLASSPPAPCLSVPVCAPKEDNQVDAWLSAMTLDEKIALVAGTGFDSVGVPRLHVPSLRMTDGPVGVRVGEATAFPASALLAATFEPEFAKRVGAAIARETKGHGKNVILGPAVNIVRTPLGGRNFEYLGEDPELAARMAVGFIQGVQNQNVMATVKHFAVNNQETERQSINVEVDERALHEIYLPAFEAAVKEAGVWSVMCAYNKVNGVFACEHPGLLDQTLRREWGFRGLVMSDWSAAHSVAPAMRAGLDLDMPKGEAYAPAAIGKALDSKAIDLALLDELVRRQLRAIAALHLDDDARERPEATDTLEHRALNREVRAAEKRQGCAASRSYDASPGGSGRPARWPARRWRW